MTMAFEQEEVTVTAGQPFEATLYSRYASLDAYDGRWRLTGDKTLLASEPSNEPPPRGARRR
jgi:hypothetical protein